MGWRSVEFILENPEEEVCHEYLRQITEFGAWHGCTPDFESAGTADKKGVVRFDLDGNSSWLDEFTPIFVEGCAQIARDMGNPGGRLSRIADEIEAQLTEQLVPKTGGFITTPRPGREGMELAWGEPSPNVYIGELQIHKQRLEETLEALRHVSGSQGWTRRIELHRLATIDSEAILRTARRLIRSLQRLSDRLPTDHLRAVIDEYDADLPGLVALRDMAEHLDEYAVGRGRADAEEEQPGSVFEYEVTPDDVVVTARSHRASVLYVVTRSEQMGPCIKSALEAHWYGVMYPDGWDFDFMVQEDDGTFAIVARDAEDADQQSFRKIANQNRANQVAAPPERPICPECGRVC